MFLFVCLHSPLSCGGFDSDFLFSCKGRENPWIFPFDSSNIIECLAHTALMHLGNSCLNVTSLGLSIVTTPTSSVFLSDRRKTTQPAMLAHW